MPDAVKVGFVPVSAAAEGVSVVFSDKSLDFGAGNPQSARGCDQHGETGRRNRGQI